jgi:hypothetical protein
MSQEYFQKYIKYIQDNIVVKNSKNTKDVISTFNGKYEILKIIKT